MDHRQGTRFRVSLPVAVTVGNTRLGWFTSRNISTGGIALNGDIDLPRNCVVVLTIEVHKGNHILTETAKAVVVHRKSGGIGLMWISRGISLQRLLTERARLIAA